MSTPNGTWPQAIPDPVATGLDDRPLRVLVADYDGLARAMMRAALNDADRIAIVLSAADGRETVQLARYYRPTVLVTELDIPPTGATDLITQVLAVSPTTRILTISAGDPRAALKTLRAGAVGHIAKETDPEQLAQIVQRVADGEPIIPTQLLTALLQLIREIPDGGWRPLHSRLTTREWEIIELLEKGASTHQIADQLVLSPTTIYSHIKSVLRKLDVHNRHDAIIAAKQLRTHETKQATASQTLTATASRHDPTATRRFTYAVNAFELPTTTPQEPNPQNYQTRNIVDQACSASADGGVDGEKKPRRASGRFPSLGMNLHADFGSRWSEPITYPSWLASGPSSRSVKERQLRRQGWPSKTGPAPGGDVRGRIQAGWPTDWSRRLYLSCGRPPLVSSPVRRGPDPPGAEA